MHRRMKTHWLLQGAAAAAVGLQLQCIPQAQDRSQEIEALRQEVQALKDDVKCEPEATASANSTALAELTTQVKALTAKHAEHRELLSGESPIPYLWAKQAKLGMNSILVNNDLINFTDAGLPVSSPGDVLRSGDDLLYNHNGTMRSLTSSPQAICSGSEVLLADGSCASISAGSACTVCGAKGLVYGGPGYTGPKDGDDCVLTPLVGADATASCSQAGLLRFDTTNNRLEYCDGSGWVWPSVGGTSGCGDGSMPNDVQNFSTSGLFVKPACYGPGAMVTIVCRGGGGGGAGGNLCSCCPWQSGSSGGSGGNGGYSTTTVPLSTFSTTTPVTVGSGGNGGSACGNSGGSGGTSQVSGLAVAGGGGGGTSSSSGGPGSGTTPGGGAPGGGGGNGAGSGCQGSCQLGATGGGSGGNGSCTVTVVDGL